MKLILRFLKPHWKLCAATIVLLTLDVMGGLVIPTLVEEMLNAGTSVAGAEDIVQVTLEGPAEDSKKEECALSGAALYDALAAAEVLPADSPRESALAYGQTLTLTLANGTVLTAPADAEAGAVRLGDWCYIGEEVKTALRSAL